MNIGRVLILLGLLIVLIGVIIVVFSKFGIQLGKLPGDIIWHKGNTTIYIPITTAILLSIILTILLRLFK